MTRKTQWEVPEGWIEEDLPRTNPEENTRDEELPPNWEIMHDPTSGKPFYVNHELKITQWNRPSEKKQTREMSNSSATATTSSAAMARILQASLPSAFSQPRSFFQEASYFQPSQSGTTGETDLSDTMPNLDFTVKKVADKHRLECPQCQSKCARYVFGLVLRGSLVSPPQLCLPSVSVVIIADFAVMCSAIHAAATV